MQLLARVLEILVLSATYPTDLAWLVIFQGFLFEAPGVLQVPPGAPIVDQSMPINGFGLFDLDVESRNLDIWSINWFYISQHCQYQHLHWHDTGTCQHLNCLQF